MKLVFLSFLIFCLFNLPSMASEFGEYRYSKYIGLQQQIQNQRMMAIKRQRLYNQNPTRNISFPSRNNPYPNITRTRQNPPVIPSQRYSARYYQKYYN